MGLIVVTIKHLLFVLQQPILIGWDRNVVLLFNKLFPEGNYFLIVLSMGMEIFLTLHVRMCRDVSLAHKHLAVAAFILWFMFRVCVHVYSSHS